MTETTQAGTALAVIPPSSLPTIIAADETDILGRLKAEMRGYVPDATTEAAREEIGRKKRKIGVAKMDFKRLKERLLEDAKKTVSAVNAEYNIIGTYCDALRDAIDAPLEAYKQIERDRVAAHQAAIEAIEALAAFDEIEPPLELIGRRRFELENRQPRQWQEFGPRAKEIIEGVKARLDALHAAAVKREADAAELDRLRAEAADKQRKESHRAALHAINDFALIPHGQELSANDLRVKLDRLDNLPTRTWEEFAEDHETMTRVVRESIVQMLQDADIREEAERQAREERIAAEAAARAKADAEAKAATDAKAEADRVEAQRIAAERKAQEAAELAERERLAAIAKAEADAKAAAAKADAERQAIERQKQEAELATKRAQEAAAQAERDRAAAVTKAEQDRVEAERRAELVLAQAQAKAEMDQQYILVAERQRVAEAEAAQEAETARRTADKAHRAEFNREALADLVAAGVSDAHARTVIAAVAKGAVRHIEMRY